MRSGKLMLVHIVIHDSLFMRHRHELGMSIDMSGIQRHMAIIPYIITITSDAIKIYVAAHVGPI